MVTLIFIAFFETVLGREHSGKVSKKIIVTTRHNNEKFLLFIFSTNSNYTVVEGYYFGKDSSQTKTVFVFSGTV